LLPRGQFCCPRGKLKNGGKILEDSFELKGKNGDPIYVIYKRDDGVHFWWEYYKRPGLDEPDLEVSFDVSSDVIKTMFKRFGLDENLDAIEGFKIISDLGYGDKLKSEIIEGVFPRTNKFSWMSW